MKTATLAIAMMLTASLIAPTAYAKKKHVSPPPQASDTSQAGGLPATNERVAALESAVLALSRQLATIPTVFVAEGFVNNLKGTTSQIAATTVPAGTYLIMSAVQMVSSQSGADAKARCVMTADGNLLADTSDLQFPILTTVAGPPSAAFGSTIFAPLQGSYSSLFPFTIRIDCSEGNGGQAGLDAFVNIAAFKVATVQK
jgi:hypothetical protein